MRQCHLNNIHFYYYYYYYYQKATVRKYSGCIDCKQPKTITPFHTRFKTHCIFLCFPFYLIVLLSILVSVRCLHRLARRAAATAVGEHAVCAAKSTAVPTRTGPQADESILVQKWNSRRLVIFCLKARRI